MAEYEAEEEQVEVAEEEEVEVAEEEEVEVAWAAGEAAEEVEEGR